MAEAQPRVMVITPEGRPAGEHAALAVLFAAGVQRVHVRKPGFSAEELHTWLDECPAAWRPALTLHGDPALARAWGLGGAHGPQLCSGHGLRASRSWHQLDEPLAAVDYGFLSPVFPSISKPGYTPRWSLEQCQLAANKWPVPVYALGGVTPECCGQLAQCGFAGVAVLGWLWQGLVGGSQAVAERYARLAQAWPA